MLSPADRAVVERDRALPGLGVLLDPEAMRDVVQDACALDVEAVTPTYVRYKPGTNALVAYDLLVDGRRERLHAKALAAGAGADPRLAAKLHKTVARPSTTSALGFAHLVLPRDAVVLTAFPNDHKVRGLRTAMSDTGRRALLRRAVPSRPDLWDATLEPLAYKPERRFVAALRHEDQRLAVLRLYARGGLPLSGPTLASGVTVPATLGVRPSRDARVTTWIDGLSLDRCLVTGSDAGVAREVGRTIARWHSTSDPNLPERRYADERGALEASWALVDALLPDQGLSARDLATRLALLLRAPVRPVTLHGDLHAAQVLLTAQGVAFVDLDESCRGAAGSDLGGFLASLLADAVTGRWSLADARDACDLVVEGYAREAGDIPVALDAWAAAHLVRRAPLAFRLRAEAWPWVAARLLALGRELVEAPRWRERVSAAGLPRVADAAMPALTPATTPRAVERAIASTLGSGWRHVRVCDVRVVRHKAGRRCLIEYDLAGLPPRPDRIVTVLGKVRARGADVATATLMAHLWAHDFAPDSDHGASVPQPLGVLPELSLWLQARVPGEAATTWAFGPEGPSRLRRAAVSIRRLHTSSGPVSRTHGVADEIAVLQPRLARLAQARPDLAPRVARMCDGVTAGLLALPTAMSALLHRDLHPDHLIWNDTRLHLIDFDLAARGDAGLDVGNLAAHLLELGLRTTGDVSSLQAATEAFVASYLDEAPDVTPVSVRTWTTAALARLAALSVELPGRAHTTDTLLALCERRLGEDVPGLLEAHS